MPSSAIFDLSALLARASEDHALVRELLCDFLLSSETTLGEVIGALEERRFLEASRYAHRLRGTLLSLGADQAADEARAVEHLAASLREKAAWDVSDGVSVAQAAKKLRESFLEACCQMRRATVS